MPEPPRFLRIFEGKALAEELTAAGHQISEKTVQRWQSGKTPPKPQDLAAIRALVASTIPGTKKEAPPAEASGAVAPEWALQLTKELRDEIIATRSAVVAPLAREVATRAGEELRELLPQLLAALARAGEDQ